jgi:hypothetical protein
MTNTQARAGTVAAQDNVYRGEKPLPLRPGAMDAYELPSLQNGERIERRRPMLIAASVEVRKFG